MAQKSFAKTTKLSHGAWSMERRNSQISPTPKGVPEKLKEAEKPMVCPNKA
jgi:hypothetical protein